MRRRLARPFPPRDLTACGAIPALLAAHRARYGDARMEGEGETGGGAEGAAGGGAEGKTGEGTGTTDKGFPESTPLAEMSTEQREAYWKHQARKHEGTAKARADYDDLKAKAAELEQIKAANATDQEKAVKAARDEAAAEERKRVAPLLVTAKFEAAAAGRIEAERLSELLEDLDLSKYLTDKGEVDGEKVTKKVAAWAPSDSGDGKGRARGFPDLGQGKRGGSVSTKGAAGLAEAQRRFPQATSK